MLYEHNTFYNHQSLEDTISDMVSGNYQTRFIAEYNQLVIRHDKLKTMLDKYHNGTLNFTPNCPIALLNAQLNTMETYLDILKDRMGYEFDDSEEDK